MLLKEKSPHILLPEFGKKFGKMYSFAIKKSQETDFAIKKKKRGDFFLPPEKICQKFGKMYSFAIKKSQETAFAIKKEYRHIFCYLNLSKNLAKCIRLLLKSLRRLLFSFNRFGRNFPQLYEDPPVFQNNFLFPRGGRGPIAELGLGGLIAETV